MDRRAVGGALARPATRNLRRPQGQLIGGRDEFSVVLQSLAGWFNAASGRGNSAGGLKGYVAGELVGFFAAAGWCSEGGHRQMESLSQNARPCLAGCLLVGLTAIAILPTLGSLLSRLDSEEEFLEGRVIDLAIVALIWAAVTFVNSRCRGRSALRASILAAVTYILLASLLLALNNAKHSVRNAAWDRLRKGVIEAPAPAAP